MYRRRRGFTLIEILLVIAIIAMLAALVAPNFIRTGEQARIDATRILVAPRGELATQIQLFHTHLGRYPRELAELANKPADEKEAAKWAGPYVEDAASFNDAWSSELEYRQPSESQEFGYDLWSKGPDRQDGTEDDIRNHKS